LPSNNSAVKLVQPELEALLKRVVQAHRVWTAFLVWKNDVPDAPTGSWIYPRKRPSCLTGRVLNQKNRLSGNAKRCLVKGETSGQGEVVPWWLRYQRDKRELAGQLKIGPDRTENFSMKAAAKEGKKQVALADVTVLHEGLSADLEWSTN
jgi:hypothetical protein